MKQGFPRAGGPLPPQRCRLLAACLFLFMNRRRRHHDQAPKRRFYMMMAGTSTLALMDLWGRTLPPLT